MEKANGEGDKINPKGEIQEIKIREITWEHYEEAAANSEIAAVWRR